MRSIVDNDYLTMFSRVLIAVLFIYASFYKIVEPALFAKSIWYYHLVPGKLINLAALILPWLELFCGLALILGIVYRGAVVWVNVMTAAFIIALAYTIALGIDIDCGCFKAAGSATGPAWNSLLLDLGMIVFTLQLLFSRSRRWRLQPRS
ncbi:MAG TPA: MauE/DoxX family redox-associated membrane protein [Acidobacteriota bacterium]|nr:MauE/DoxX family redox-associated membrane protein [Acidobacteriota bacterium]